MVIVIYIPLPQCMDTRVGGTPFRGDFEESLLYIFAWCSIFLSYRILPFPQLIVDMFQN